MGINDNLLNEGRILVGGVKDETAFIGRQEEALFSVRMVNDVNAVDIRKNRPLTPLVCDMLFKRFKFGEC